MITSLFLKYSLCTGKRHHSLRNLNALCLEAWLGRWRNGVLPSNDDT